MTGAPGTGTGTTAADPEAGPVPTPLVAVIDAVYDVPFVKPGTLSDVAVTGADNVLTTVPETVSRVVIVYPVIDEPLPAGPVHVSDNNPAPRTATNDPGAPGTGAGTTAADTDAGPVPTPLVAVIDAVYDVPFVKPGTVSDVAVTGADNVLTTVPDTVSRVVTVYPEIDEPLPAAPVHVRERA